MNLVRAFRAMGAAFALMLVGSLIASAVTGTAPMVGGGYALVDQNWLNGLANGVNSSFQSGITAAGTTQATCTALPSSVTLLEIDTTPASSGVCLPSAQPGVDISIYNNGANTLTVFPAVANNLATSAQDTINNGTSVVVSSHAAEFFFSAKVGVWAAK